MSAGTVLQCIPTMAGGGAERQLTYLTAELRRIGWDVHVALMRRGVNWNRLTATGAVIHELNARNAYDPRLVSGLRHLVNRTEPDLVQAWLPQMEALAAIAAATTGTPWLLSERASAAAYPTSAKSIMRRAIAQTASAIVSNSAAGDEYWRRRVRRQVARYIIPNGVPLDEIARTPPISADQLGIESGEPLVLFAGRFVTQKNIDVMLAAFGLLLSRRPVQVRFCGEGPLHGTIARWIVDQRAGRHARIMGYMTDLWGVMKRATVVVSPSLFEGNPNVVLEAMAVGAPLVVSDIPEHRELLDDESAVFVDPRSVEGLVAAIDRVFESPEGAARRASAASARVQRHGVAAIATRYNEVYTDIVSHRRGR